MSHPMKEDARLLQQFPYLAGLCTRDELRSLIHPPDGISVRRMDENLFYRVPGPQKPCDEHHTNFWESFHWYMWGMNYDTGKEVVFELGVESGIAHRDGVPLWEWLRLNDMPKLHSIVQVTRRGDKLMRVVIYRPPRNWKRIVETYLWLFAKDFTSEELAKEIALANSERRW